MPAPNGPRARARRETDGSVAGALIRTSSVVAQEPAPLADGEEGGEHTCWLTSRMPVWAGSVYRHGTPPVAVAMRRFRDESDAEYVTAMLSLPAHSATHVDLVIPGRRIAPERMIGPGRLVDVRGLGGDLVRMRDIERQDSIPPGDFVVFRTGWSRFCTEAYFKDPELSGRRTVAGVAPGKRCRDRRPRSGYRRDARPVGSSGRV